MPLRRGICCCDAWQSWSVWTNHTMQVAVESLRSQVKRLRRFPSVVTFLYSSDQLPPPEVEQAYLDVFHSERWAVGLINSAVRLERLPIPVHLSCVCGAESRTTDENMSWRHGRATCTASSAASAASRWPVHT